MKRYRVMARMVFELKHHQEGPDYETRADAEDAAREWDGQGGAIAHVEPVPIERRHHREGEATP